MSTMSLSRTAVESQVLTPEASSFLTKLARTFEGRRQELLAQRAARQREIDRGQMPEFLPETATIRKADWKVAPIPKDLLDRRVEITGPVDRKMIINALNSGAKVFMADFEDAHAPTWSSTLEGQVNLFDTVRRTIRYTSATGRDYRLNDRTATLVVRPRGLHLPEKHFRVHGRPIRAALFDFGLFFYHNARQLMETGSGPYFY